MAEKTVRYCDVCHADITDTNCGYTKRYRLKIDTFDPKDGQRHHGPWDLCKVCWKRMKDAVGMP